MKKYFISLIAIALLTGCTTPVEVDIAEKSIDSLGKAQDMVDQINKRTEADNNIINEINIKLSIDDSSEIVSHNLSAQDGDSVFDVLKKFSDENGLDLKYKESSFGVFVESINDIENNGKKNMYWMYEVNGEEAQVGASEYKLKEGDAVSWIYKDTSNY